MIDDLDHDQIPVRLRNIARVKIGDINSFEEELNKIANTILGICDNPQSKKHPNKILEILEFPNLNKIDSLVLKTIGDIACEIDNEYIEGSNIGERLSNDFPENEIRKSLEVLKANWYISYQRYGRGIEHDRIEIYQQSILGYAKLYRPNFDKIARSVMSLI